MATQLRHEDEAAETALLAGIDPTRADLYADDSWRPVFARLRRDAPVHWCADSPFGPYWSISRHADIQAVEARPDLFSSSWEHGGITAVDLFGDLALPQFIAMDRPQHGEQRRVVAPSFGPGEMARMATEIRKRTGELLDTLPVDEDFDWVDRVSIELTTQMLAILFDFPWEDRRLLTLWSDWGGDIEAAVNPATSGIRQQHLIDMTDYLDRLMAERRAKDRTDDLLSLMVHSAAMGDMSEQERRGNYILLIVGGNDTTRNSMSGAIHAFDQYPGEWRKLAVDRSLIPAAVPEIIRWQTPLAHMRRTCAVDTEVGGQAIKAGEKVIMWYISANRDESVFPDAERLDVTRTNARRHLAFGFGVHRCVGARLAELQLQILFEAMLDRGMTVKVTGAPDYVPQSFVHGYRKLPVRITRS